MNQSIGSPLYLKVEEALKDFQSGVSRLKAQQQETDCLLATGNEALANLARQVACIGVLQQQVESDLRLLERFRQGTAEEIDLVRQQMLAEHSQHQEHIRIRVNNLQTDLSVRRQELLGLIRDLRQELKGIEGGLANTQQVLSAIRANEGAWERVLAGLKHQIEMHQNHQHEVSLRLARIERRNKFLAWAVLALLVLAVIILLR